MNDETLVSILSRCNSQDNDIREAAELERNEHLETDTNTFIITLFNLILANSYQELMDYFIINLYTIFKRRIQLIDLQFFQDFFQIYDSNFSKLINNICNGDNQSLRTQWFIDLYALLLSDVHKLFPDSDFNANSVIEGLQKNVSPKVLVPIISKTLDLSQDIWNFDLGFLLQIINEHVSFNAEIIKLYFSIISKIPENEEFKEIFPSILNLMNNDINVGLTSILNFCDSSSPFISCIITDLANFILDLLLNQSDEQIGITCLMILESMATNNAKYAISSKDFISLIFDNFVSFFNNANYTELDDNSSTIYSLALDTCKTVFETISSNSLEKIDSLFDFVSENNDYLFGSLITMSNLMVFKFPKIIFLLNQIIQYMENDNIRFALCMLLSNEQSRIVKSSLRFQIFQNFMEFFSENEEEILIYWLLKTVTTLLIGCYCPENEEFLFNYIPKILEAFDYKNCQTERVISCLVAFLSLIYQKLTKSKEIEEIVGNFNQLFERYQDYEMIRAEIIKEIPDLFQAYNNPKNSQIISEVAAEFYNVISQIYTLNAIPPQYMQIYADSLLKLISFIDDQIDNSFMTIYQSIIKIIDQNLVYNEANQEIIDSSALFVAQNIKEGTKYTIEKSVVQMILEGFEILLKIAQKKNFFYFLVENNYKVFSKLINTCMSFVSSDYFLETLFKPSLELLIILTEISFSHEENEANFMKENIINIMNDVIPSLTTLPIQKSEDLVDSIKKFAKSTKNFMDQYDQMKSALVEFAIVQVQKFYNIWETYRDNDDPNFNKFELIDNSFYFSSIQLMGVIQKIVPNLIIQEFISRIIPKIENCKDDLEMMSVNSLCLMKFMKNSPDSSIYSEYRELLFYFLNRYIELGENEEEYYDDSFGSLYRFLNEYFPELFKLILKIDLSNELASELCNNLINIAQSTNLCKETDLPNCIFLIYYKYPEILQENQFEQVFKYCTFTLAQSYKDADDPMTYHFWSFWKLCFQWIERFHSFFQIIFTTKKGKFPIIWKVFHAFTFSYICESEEFYDKYYEEVLNDFRNILSKYEFVLRLFKLFCQKEEQNTKVQKLYHAVCKN
ncbi:hypothetical protein TVAG_495760 [Trichomonas vaginalis G3]|uniref:Uncharacterized protein n=1 Tax=Trichomonas vaginalis (strain ATCC PRA-98 / G3) TaxID=412133 RepID=A2DVL5_TRIV3|nr:armadillo (ARM) repeat-containing protein family [Trichomonas vaginalis G3]EAY15557.1 hypothetical protein TVAG_495760 [Trichomonas vaginalis G3]KAI5526202.1 armadillo (ARM) repeat-containing protein family [Trichomonas vaginalis G3]|eukprot:XP_001327780.1 hypothetical protein [Trichomonas vaginalis G3]